MIISINFPTSSTSSSTPKLPPALAKISHDELVLIELQGALEVECTHDEERDGRLVGQLCIDEVGGKVAQLPKPLAILQRVPNVDADAMNCDDPEDSGSQRAETSGAATVSWDAIAVIRRKIVFAKRPMPIVGRPQA
ncbi:hypothetical protein B0H16DRAFT_1557743 [Mycena metata]|uniref:Uncharacterized protein n=1 Tax=Mycena metata TaxID=1033252 RepID=A0AAD7IL09_9AGAR|nr:hypothetical protein B0H16DRAFT_1557743 [Mycena metata]